MMVNFIQTGDLNPKTRKITTITIEEHAFRYEVDFPETIIPVSIQF